MKGGIQRTKWKDGAVIAMAAGEVKKEEVRIGKTKNAAAVQKEKSLWY